MSSEDFSAASALAPPPPPNPAGLFGGLGGIHRHPQHQERAPAALKLSPYLNVNPSYVQTPEFIVNQEQKKGRIEQSFAGIGASVISGGAAGGAYGFYDGLRQTAATGIKGASRRTQILNYTVKTGGSVSNALGTLAVMYSCIHTLASQWHEEDDEIKCLGSGLLTGALFKSTAGIVKCATAAAFGLGVAASWSFVLKRNEAISLYI